FENLQHSGFYYIGKKSSQIQKLVKMYKRGYSSEGMDNMKAELMRSLEQERNIFPEVIVCEASFKIEDIHNFVRFVRQHPVLRSIPFILDSTGIKEEDLAMYRKLIRPDD